MRNFKAVQWLQGSTASAESRPSRIGPITLDAKQTGERSEGNPYATFDVRRGGDWKRKDGRDAVTPRNRKGEATGNTNCDLKRRASLRSLYVADCLANKQML